MLWRHPNVYGDISAYFPSGLEQTTIRFMGGSRGRDKVLFGTNGLGLKRCIEEFKALPIKDDSKRKILRDNAIEFLKLQGIGTGFASVPGNQAAYRSFEVSVGGCSEVYRKCYEY